MSTNSSTVPEPTAAAMGIARGFLVDLDGTLIHGSERIDGAREFLALYGARTIVVSNNSSDTPRTMSLRLERAGLPIDAVRIVLAGALAVETIAALHPSARTLLLGSAALAEHARHAGLAMADDAPDVVIVARDECFDYAALARAANAIHGGAKFYATNPDLTHPGRDGRLVPETGALTAAVAAAVGRTADAVFGKPAPALFAAGLKRLGTAAHETLVIGDNPATDGAGARGMGLGYLEVGERAGRTIADLLAYASEPPGRRLVARIS